MDLLKLKTRSLENGKGRNIATQKAAETTQTHEDYDNKYLNHLQPQACNQERLKKENAKRVLMRSRKSDQSDVCPVEHEKERNWTFTNRRTSSRTVFEDMKNSFLATSGGRENKKTVSKADIMEEFKGTESVTSGQKTSPNLNDKTLRISRMCK